MKMSKTNSSFSTAVKNRFLPGGLSGLAPGKLPLTVSQKRQIILVTTSNRQIGAQCHFWEVGLSTVPDGFTWV